MTWMTRLWESVDAQTPWVMKLDAEVEEKDHGIGCGEENSISSRSEDRICARVVTLSWLVVILRGAVGRGVEEWEGAEDGS